jgi:hypothetical protein
VDLARLQVLSAARVRRLNFPLAKGRKAALCSAMNDTRRSFLKTSTLAASAFETAPRHVLGGQGQTPPSEKLQVAGEGVGGMGQNNVRARRYRDGWTL